MGERRWRCGIGWHQLVLRQNDEGGRYFECKHCGKYDDKSQGANAPFVF